MGGLNLPLTKENAMTYRITRKKLGGDHKDRQGYYLEANNKEEAITIFFNKYPEYAGEEIELEEWS